MDQADGHCAESFSASPPHAAGVRMLMAHTATRTATVLEMMLPDKAAFDAIYQGLLARVANPTAVSQPANRAGMPADRLSCWLLAGLLLCGLSNVAGAATITLSGNITQSTKDGTGPAVNNPSLNNIFDLQAYTVTLMTPGTLTGAGTYNLTGSTLTFSVPAASATESNFSSISLTVTSNAAVDRISLLACLTTGSGCMVGNQLTANFSIPASMLNSQDVTAIGLDQPHPLDLLEDDGTTDIQGSITSYSYTGAGNTVPEPSAWIPASCFLAIVLIRTRERVNQMRRNDQ